MGENLAAIDIGTNSIHLVVARFDDDGHFEVIADEKETVRLGSGGGDMKELAPDAIERGIAALSRFRQVADISDATLLGGSPRPADVASTPALDDAVAAGCHIETEAETKANYGVVLVLGGNSTLRIRNQSVVELFGYVDPGGGTSDALSILQLPATIDVAKASTIALNNGPLVEMAPGSRAHVSVHGGVYAPRARVSAFGTNQAWVELQGGVVAAALDLQAAPGPTNFAVSTQVGASSRTIRLEATTNRVGNEKQITAVAEVVAVNDASRTVTVTSWRVEQ